jgi:hypothetical protein
LSGPAQSKAVEALQQEGVGIYATRHG